MEACTSRLRLRPVQSFSVGRVGGGRDSIHLSSKPQWPEFLNNSHLTYHNHGLSITCDGKKDAVIVLSKGSMKKKLQLLKGLSTDLSMYTKMAADGDIAMLSDLAQILMSQLEQMKEQKKEMKRKRKEEKKLNTSKTKSSKKDKNSSASPSESDSSNSELFITNSSSELVEPIHTKIKGDVALDCSTSARSENTNSAVAELFAGRIDVCMGGKCKKFGAVELLDQLQKKIGVQGAVVGCKCMGMCRNAPNVRVSTNSVTGPEHPMNITGVGLEDVDTIASRFLCDRGRNVDWMEAS